MVKAWAVRGGTPQAQGVAGHQAVTGDNAIRPPSVAVTCVRGLPELFFCSCCSDNYLQICVLAAELGVEEYMVDVRRIVLTKVLVSWNSSRKNDMEMWEDVL